MKVFCLKQEAQVFSYRDQTFDVNSFAHFYWTWLVFIFYVLVMELLMWNQWTKLFHNQIFSLKALNSMCWKNYGIAIQHPIIGVVLTY